MAAIKSVTPRFFETMGIPLRLGRDFLPLDVASGAPKVAIINERFARQFFGGRNPVGKHIGVGGKTADLEIAGVIADTKYRSLRDTPPATVYLPIDQLDLKGRPGSAPRTLHVRTSANLDNMSGVNRAAGARAGPESAGFHGKCVFEDHRRAVGSGAACRSPVGLLRRGGNAARLLRFIRRNGVQRAAPDSRNRHSNGARRGTRRRDRHGDAPERDHGSGRRCSRAALVRALWLSKLVASLLFGVKPGDLATLAAAAVLLLAVAALAAYLPARRAARIDPTVALRYE